MRICFFYQNNAKPTTEKKKIVFIFSFPRTYKKGNIFVWIKNMNIKRVCLWTYLSDCDKMIEKKLVVLSFHEKIIKETQHIKHQSMIVFPCVWNHSLFFCLFVCLFLQKKSLKWISFLWNMHYLLSEKIILEYHERICLFNEERKISMKRCDFPLKTSSFLNEICFVLWWIKHFSSSENEIMHFKCIQPMNLERKVYSSSTRKERMCRLFFFHVLSFCWRGRRAMWMNKTTLFFWK